MSAAKKKKPHPAKKPSNATHRHAHAAHKAPVNVNQVRWTFGVALSAIFLVVMHSQMSAGVNPQWLDVMPKF